MSSFGTLYAIPTGNSRSLIPQIAAKYAGVDITVVPTAPHQTPADFPLGKVPAFKNDKIALTECVAISQYIANGTPALVGTTPEEKADILRWQIFSTAEVNPSIWGWYAPLAGFSPYRKDEVEAQKAQVIRWLKYTNDYLADKTYLVGHNITLADLQLAVTFAIGAVSVIGPELRAEYSNVFRWVKTIINQPFVKEVAGEIEYSETQLVYTPPKKEKKAAPAAAAAAPAAAAPAAAAEEVTEKKAKHPIEALGPAKSFPLDEFKRQYSNNDTPIAMKWLDEHFSAEDYSIWRVDYKYQDELTQVFMSSNLIGGFHNRLEGSRKYLFGSAGVYGENNNSKIVGVYMLRGQDYEPIFNVAPDYESYSFQKLDLIKDHDLIAGAWEWTNEIDGLKYNDGKVFK